MLSEVKLVDGDRSMILRPNVNIGATTLDFGFPSIRGVSDPWPDADGERDTTKWIGASAVSLSMTLLDNTRATLDELRTYCSPRARPYLYVTDTEWATQRRIKLRIDQQSAPIEKSMGLLRNVQVQWRAPEGVWEDADITETTMYADDPNALGLLVDDTLGVTSDDLVGVTVLAGASGAAGLTVTGTFDGQWIARLYGPCTGPKLILDPTGEAITFLNNFTIIQGSYVEVNSRDRTVFADGNPAVSRLNKLDFAQTTWWRLPANALNSIRYTAVSGVTAATQAVILWRNTWL